jgi:HAD superfamily hydrolase (TIGR01509 family)
LKTLNFKDIKGVIFDLDGTLVDSMWIWRQIDIEFLEKRGIDLPDELQKEIEGKSFTETAHYFKDRFQLPETIESIQNEWNEMARLFYKERIPLKNGVLEFLEKVHSKGLLMGIGTSNSRELLVEILKSKGIEKYFKTIRTSCEVPRGKPYPDIFLKVAEDMGLDPSECVVFEDTHAGVTAAKSAGMQAVAIYDALSEPYTDAIKESADHFMDDFMVFEPLF